MYACKVFDTESCSKSDTLMALKEIKINSMLGSKFCLQNYDTIMTSNKIYMIHEYTNCLDLECLLQERGSLRQEEARIIMHQLVKGVKDLQSINIVHRNLKPINILLHFPDDPKVDLLTLKMKRKFL